MYHFTCQKIATSGYNVKRNRVSHLNGACGFLEVIFFFQRTMCVCAGMWFSAVFLLLFFFTTGLASNCEGH